MAAPYLMEGRGPRSRARARAAGSTERRREQPPRLLRLSPNAVVERTHVSLGGAAGFSGTLLSVGALKKEKKHIAKVDAIERQIDFSRR